MSSPAMIHLRPSSPPRSLVSRRRVFTPLTFLDVHNVVVVILGTADEVRWLPIAYEDQYIFETSE